MGITEILLFVWILLKMVYLIIVKYGYTIIPVIIFKSNRYSTSCHIDLSEYYICMYRCNLFDGNCIKIGLCIEFL